MTTGRPPAARPGQRPAPQQRPQVQARQPYGRQQAPAGENPAWQLANEMLGVLHDLAAMQYHTNDLIADLIALQEDTDLYCPPSDHCSGGILLRHSTVFADDLPAEKRRDKFYHPLPEAAWYDLVDKDKTFHVRNHNVWRSQAVHAGGDEVAEPMPPEERVQTRAAAPAGAAATQAAEPVPGIALAGSTITVETWEKVGPRVRATLDRFRAIDAEQPPALQAIWDYMTDEITARDPGDVIRRAAATVRSFLRERKSEGKAPALYFVGRSDPDAIDLGEALALFEREWDAQVAEEITRVPLADIEPSDLPF